MVATRCEGRRGASTGRPESRSRSADGLGGDSEMVIETGIVVGYLIAWAARRARRAAPHVDAVVDDAVDVGLEALHRAVVEKLGPDPALVALDRQSGADGPGDD